MAKNDERKTERVALRMTPELVASIAAISEHDERTWSDTAHRLLEDAVERKMKKDARKS